MIEFPEDVTLIPNPVNQIPVFSLHYHHFVPGFPQMAWPMLEWVLDNQYKHLLTANDLELSIRVEGSHEGAMIPLMEKVIQDYGVKIFSLPNIGENNRYVELGAKGGVLQAKNAMAEIKATLSDMKLRWDNVDS